ncbi:MAG TPA: hypothetical protein VKH37_03455, partial [Ferruginibacter sp.]|nr:hypothetical protein [Ferruginibacter sp.]
MYQQIFLNKAKNGFIDENLLPEKVDGPVIHPAVLLHLGDVKASLQVCLKIKETDLDLLLALLPDDILSFKNLSTLFCESVLMRKLKLKAPDFLILKKLIALDYQLSPETTLQFVDAVAKAKAIGLKASQLEFLLSHPVGYETLEIKDDKITTMLKALQAAYQKSFDSTFSPFDPNATAESQKEKVQSALAGLSVLNEADVKILINFIDANWDYSWTDSAYVVHTGTLVADALTFLTDKNLSSQIDTTQISNAINALPAAKDASELAEANEATALTNLNAANDALAADPLNPALIVAQSTAVTNEAATLAAANTASLNFESAKNALV